MSLNSNNKLSSNNRLSRSFPWLALVFSISGVVIWLTTLPGFVQQTWTLTYSEATGTITNSQLKKDDGSYLIDISYLYAAQGKTYLGNQYCYDPPWTNTDAWQLIQLSLPIGQQVSVFFNPSNPDESVLVRGPLGFHCGTLWFGAVFLLSGPFICHWLYVPKVTFDPSDGSVINSNTYGWDYRCYGKDWWRYWSVSAMAVCFAGVPVFHARNLPLDYFAFGFAIFVILPLCIAYRYTSFVAIHADLDNKSWTMSCRSRQEMIPIGAIHAIKTERQMQKETTGPDQPTDHFRVVVYWYTAKAKSMVTLLDKYYCEEEAEGVAHWLRSEAANNGGLTWFP